MLPTIASKCFLKRIMFEVSNFELVPFMKRASDMVAKDNPSCRCITKFRPDAIMEKRIDYLDGLRGVAILVVVLFHAFFAWGKVEPFEQNKFLADIVSFGWLGVNLFFAISGYVIYMSLIKSKNIIMFGVARYLRLAPMMLVSAVLIFVTSFYITERPEGSVSLRDFIPSITFFDPQLVGKIFGINVKSLDGAFWSLYVEVKFYFVAAALYFFSGDKSLFGLCFLYIAWFFLGVLGGLLPLTGGVVDSVFSSLDYFNIRYYPWFLIGVFSYRYGLNASASNLNLVALAVVVAVAGQARSDLGLLVASTATALLFLVPMFSEVARRLLASRVLCYLGFISYPLYLVHQNIITGLAIKLHGYLPGRSGFFYPLPFIFLVVFLAGFLASAEPRMKQALAWFFPEKIFGYDVRRK